MHLTRLPRSFYLRPTITVARELLGTFLVRSTARGRLAGRIVEVEAYRGSSDPASHAYSGPTKRNEVMFRRGGHLYVYFTYGMHFCCNVVTEEEGIGHAVLIRALEPVVGIALLARNRDLSETPLQRLCNGPAKLSQAFGLGREQNGTDLCGREIWIAEDTAKKPRFTIARSTRVGVSTGREHRWRFFIEGSPFVSPGRPS